MRIKMKRIFGILLSLALMLGLLAGMSLVTYADSANCVIIKQGDSEGNVIDGETVTLTEYTGTSFPTSGNYYLTKDLEVSDRENKVKSGDTLNLNLNGHHIIFNTGQRSAVIIDGGIFNLWDTAGGGYIDSNRNSLVDNNNPYPDFCLIKNGGSFNMYGGTIKGGYYDNDSGAGVYNTICVGNYDNSDANASFRLFNGKLTKSSRAYVGGAVTVKKNNYFYMYGGEVSDNKGTYGGGIGIYGTAYIFDGKIKNNVAKSGGGGIELEEGGKLYMYGGAVTENRVLAKDSGMYKGGGIHVPEGSELHILGSVIVKDNYQGNSDTTKQNNVFVRKESAGKIIIDGPLTADANIGLGTNADSTFVFTANYSKYHSNDPVTKYFSSDVTTKPLKENDAGEININCDKAKTATVTANSRIYDGTAKPLVKVTGEAVGGEMMYAIGKEKNEPDKTAYTTSIPFKTSAGTYYVWYKAAGDKRHYDSASKRISVTIKVDPEAHVHEIEKLEAKDSTCTEDGYKSHYECTKCGMFFEDKTGSVEITDRSPYILEATGHKWDDGVVTKEATYDETGIKTFTCENDPSHTKEEVIPMKEYRESDTDNSDGSSGGGSGKNSGSVSKQSIDVNGNTISSNHQAETGVPASDVGGRWANSANADIWTYTKSDGTLAKSEWMSLDYNGLRYWYYFNEDGIMLTNWFDYNGERFYLMPEKDGWRGRMATGWKNIDNKWYYFDIVPGSTQGKLYRGAVTPDGHVVGADGAWNGVGETPVGQE